MAPVKLLRRTIDHALIYDMNSIKFCDIPGYNPYNLQSKLYQEKIYIKVSKLMKKVVLSCRHYHTRILSEACYKNDNNKVKKILDIGKADVIYYQSDTVIIAVKRNNIELFDMLVEAGADVKKLELENIVSISVSFFAFEITYKLIKLGCKMPRLSISAIQKLTSNNYLDMLKYVIEQNKENANKFDILTTKYSNKYTIYSVLDYFVDIGNVEMVDFLVAHGAKRSSAIVIPDGPLSWL